MSGSQWVAVALAVAGAFLYVVGMALQQKGNLAAIRHPRGSGTAGRVLSVLAQPVWIVGLVSLAAGLTLDAVALAVGALIVVQPVHTIELVFMVPASAWVAGVDIERRDWQGAGLVVVGLVVFYVATRPAGGDDLVSGWLGWAVAAGVMAFLAGSLWGLALGLAPYRAAMMGAAIGVLSGFQAAILKQAAGQVGEGLDLGDPSSWWALPVVAASGTFLLVLQNLALRAGRLSSSMAAIRVLAPVSAVALGIALFGESVSTDAWGLLGAGAGALGAFAGVVLLARSPALVAGQPVGRTDEAAHTQDEVRKR